MVWLFGYGSLIWKVDFPFEKKVTGYVQGFKRRFWWWSEDHRGVPGKPGRVVNLLKSENPSEKVWGVAYYVSDQVWRESVQKHLDHREKGGYSRQSAHFHPSNGNDPCFPVTLYIGSPQHRQYAGPALLEDLASTIFTSTGPSGKNSEYLYNLASALKAMGVEDEHVIELEAAVRALEKENK